MSVTESVERTGQIVGLLFQVGDVGFAQGFLELALEFVGHAADLAEHLADGAQYGWQLLRPDRNQRDDADEDKLAPTKIEHGRLTPSAGS